MLGTVQCQMNPQLLVEHYAVDVQLSLFPHDKLQTSLDMQLQACGYNLQYMNYKSVFSV